MSNRRLKYSFAFVVTLLLVVIIVPDVIAQQTFSDAIDQFQQVDSQLWRAKALDIGSDIFFVLAVLDIIFYGVSISQGWIKRSIAEVVVREGILLGIAGIILIFYDTFDGLVWGFIDIAQEITGIGNNLNESKIFFMGWDYFLNTSSAALENISFGDIFSLRGVADGTLISTVVLFKAGLNTLCGFVVFVGFFVIAVQYAFITIKVIIVLTTGPVFISFLPFKPTKRWGERYLAYLFKLGIQLFFFYIILGFSMSVLTELIGNIETSSVPDFSESWELAFMAVLGVFLLAKIPGEASSYITQDTEFSISSILPSQVKT
ncbi:TrbL/VirB6 plasmid conjugal transfer protein [Fodinibius roseus]|uniref:TrbL/VirB6 plasmid conjugal transfer protein n=1 Tax=Fodinibius roseus TaxID=1194090 RepID=A0A1M5KPQ6_9BACT|nr:type IV secretion system protein [Fodinibius roseus]SHG54715.1 TrbL/VirB6 plasmid conjugal transfer protein [Fodinibius roseus]